MNMNVYKGVDGLKDFLNPMHHLTPVVELPKALNPVLGEKVRIFVKLQTFLPLMNIKSLPAHNMLKKDKSGRKRIVESSSGNMAFSLSILSRVMGFDKMQAVISNEVGLAKLQALLLSGAEIVVNREPICPNPKDNESGINLAKRKAKRGGWLNLNQYANSDNPEGHRDVCGKQIIEQLRGDLQICANCLGTTGSLIGLHQALKSHDEKIRMLGIVRKPNNPVPGPRTIGLLNMIDFDWRECCDDIVDIGTAEAYAASMELCRNGILAGPSTGLSFAGLLRYLKRLKAGGKLEELRNKNGEINCLFLACDLPFLYLDDYFRYVPANKFPKIKNKHLLKKEPVFAYKKPDKKISISAPQLLKQAFGMSAKKLWKTGHPDIADDFCLIDLREKNLFNCGHIPQSTHLLEKEIMKNIGKYAVEWENKKVVFICEYGEISFYLANLFRDKGIAACSLQGGMTQWSSLNYPRQSRFCPIKHHPN